MAKFYNLLPTLASSVEKYVKFQDCIKNTKLTVSFIKTYQHKKMKQNCKNAYPKYLLAFRIT